MIPVSWTIFYAVLHNPQRSISFIIIGSKAPILNMTAVASPFWRQLQSKIIAISQIWIIVWLKCSELLSLLRLPEASWNSAFRNE